MYDHIVIGAGIAGSWTACLLAERGKKVLLVEQFSLRHSRGSSHGPHRGIGWGHNRGSSHGPHRGLSIGHVNRLASELVQLSFPYWEKLNKEADEPLLWPFPMLNICAPKDFPNQERMKENIDHFQPGSYQWLNGEQMRTRCPYVHFPLDHRGLVDANGARFHPSRVMRTLHHWFERLGGTIVENFKVDTIGTSLPVTISGSKGSYCAESLIICAGGWTEHLLSQIGVDLPLTCLTILITYFRIKEGYSYTSNTSFSYEAADGQSYLAFVAPIIDEPHLVKVVYNHGIETKPDERDKHDDSQIVEESEKLVREHWPVLEKKMEKKENCMYTMTPDKVFILDRHPAHSNILYAAGFSGYGYQIAPAIGELLADLVEGKPTKLDTEVFKANRLKSTVK